MRKLKCLILLFPIIHSLSAQMCIKKVDKLLLKEKFSKAENIIKKKYSNDSINREYYYYMGEINRRTGQYEAAMRYFKKVLEIDSNSAGAIGSIGVAYAQKGNTNEAFRWINHAIEIDSTNDKLYNQ